MGRRPPRSRRLPRGVPPDGVLVLLDPADPTVVTPRQGHEELGDITTVIDRAYDKTFHFVGTTRCEVDGDRAPASVLPRPSPHCQPARRHRLRDDPLQDTYSRRHGVGLSRNGD